MSLSRTFFFAALLLGLVSPSRAQLQFNFTYDPGINPTALAGFQAAAARWSAVFSDPITINFDIGFEALSPGVIGSASSELVVVNYAPFKTAMLNDRTSADDFAAVATLPAGPSTFNVLLNNTVGHTATPYTGSSGALVLSRANAKALGLLAASGVNDASITFSSAFNFDFDPTNGITAGQYDFVGAATHEIGHALGFSSGVDYLDGFAIGTVTEANTYQTPLDMFRYSTESVALGLIDGTADTRAKFLSINSGATSLGGFSTGRDFGDGQQASHWKDSLGLGTMDPTAAAGELLQLTTLDFRAFDIMGYNLVAIPEPADVAGWIALIAAGVVVLRRRQRQPRG